MGITGTSCQNVMTSFGLGKYVQNDKSLTLEFGEEEMKGVRDGARGEK